MAERGFYFVRLYPTTCASGKVRYHSKVEALITLRAARGAKARKYPERQERRAYHCDRCDGWHLTSTPERPGPPSGRPGRSAPG